MSTLKTLSGAGLLTRALVCITLALLGVSVALLIAEGFGLILWFDVFASSALLGNAVGVMGLLIQEVHA